MSPDVSSPPEPTPKPAQPDSAGMTGEQLAEAKRYGRLDLYCTLADKALDVAYLAVAAFLLGRPIHGWLEGFLAGESYWWMSLRLVVLFWIVTALHVGVSFPLSFYSNYVLEHRFGLSNLTFGGWLWRYTKTLLLTVAFGTAMMLGLYWLIWMTGPYWWLVAAGAFFLVSVILGQLMPVVILPLFYKIEKLDRPDLAERIGRLAQDAGLSVEGVYRIKMSAETVKANAMLAGVGRTRRVLLGDTLLDSFEPDEIEVIFAHEIGHHVFGHIRKILLAGVVYSAAGFWVCDRLLCGWVGRFGGEPNYHEMPVWTLPLVLLVLLLFAMLLEPLQNAFSRRHERQSDRYALERTGLTDAYVAAFRKLARLNKDDPHPHWLDVLLFHGHPPIAQRLALAEQRQGEKP